MVVNNYDHGHKFFHVVTSAPLELWYAGGECERLVTNTSLMFCNTGVESFHTTLYKILL